MQATFLPQTNVQLTGRAWKVFLCTMPAERAELRTTLLTTLNKAGIEVITSEEKSNGLPLNNPSTLSVPNSVVNFGDSNCCLICPVTNPNQPAELEQKQYNLAVAQNLKRIIWLPEGEEKGRGCWWFDALYQADEKLLISTAASPAQLVFDIEAFLKPQTERIANAPRYDLTIIYNEIDSFEAEKYLAALAQHSKYSINRIVATPNLEFRESVLELALKSKLTTIYFKDAGDWATYFGQAFWKYAGGACSETQILLLGESEPRRNRFIDLAAPRLKLHIFNQLTDAIEFTQNALSIVENKESLNHEKFCPYTGIRPFKEKDAIFFQGREKHVNEIIRRLTAEKFVMVTGASGDGKSSLVYAGLIPSLKGGFLPTTFHRWAIISLRPERNPLANLAAALAQELHEPNYRKIENALGYGFSALVDLYKESPLYCDFASNQWRTADDATKHNLRNQAANLLILVDQFEELFTHADNYQDGIPTARSQIMVSLLVETVRLSRSQNLPIYVVFTMRSDFIGQCVTFKGLAELIGASTFFVPRLTRDEIEQAIQQPARLNGNQISHRLTQRLLNDSSIGADQLPTLQHCLLQIWNQAVKGEEQMDLLHYALVGGLSPDRLEPNDRKIFQAWYEHLPPEKKSLYEKPRLTNVLNRHANELFEDTVENYVHRSEKILKKEEVEKVVAIIFTCLTRINQGRKVRNPIKLEEVVEIIGRNNIGLKEVEQLFAVFRANGNNFIAPYIEENRPASYHLEPDTVVEITHEALIRNWERLAYWAEEENKSAQTFGSIRTLVEPWVANNYSGRYLMSSGTFAYYNSWFEERQPNVAWIQRYAHFDAPAAEKYLQDLKKFLDKSYARTLRRRQVLGLTLLAFIGLGGLVVYYAIQTERVYNEKLIQDQQRQKERADYYYVQKLLSDEKSQGLLKNKDLEESKRLKAEQIAQIAEQQRRIERGERISAQEKQKIARLLAELAMNRLDTAIRGKVEAEQRALSASEQANVARTSAEQAERERERALKERNEILIYQSKYISAVAKEEVLRGNAELGLRLALEALPLTINQPDRPYTSEAETALYFAADAVVNSPTRLVELKQHKNKVVGATFSPNGEWLVSTSWDRTAVLWNLKTHKVERTFVHPHLVENAVFSPDSRFLLCRVGDMSAHIWDVSSGHLIAHLTGHKAELTASAFSYDRAATAALDNTIRLYTSTGQFITQINHFAPVTCLNFSPNGSYLVSASQDHSVFVLDSNTGKVKHTLKGHTGPVRSAHFSPDNRTILTAADDRTIMLWDAFSGKLLRTFIGHTGPVRSARFSPNGKYIITASADYTARVWNLKSDFAGEAAILSDHQGPVTYAAFSPDGAHIITTAADKVTRLWDADMFSLLALYTNQSSDMNFPAFNPQGDRLCLGNPKNHTLHIYQVLKNGQALIDYVRKHLQPTPLSPDDRIRFNLPQYRF